MRLYKLTNNEDQTYGGTQWGEGITHTATGEGELCGPGWIHAYTDPLLAVLLNPIHGAFDEPHLWEAEGTPAKTDHGLKFGCTSLTTVRCLPLPEITISQRVAFGILCPLATNPDKDFQEWAKGWLSGEDRSEKAAQRAVQQAAQTAQWTAQARAVQQAVPWAAQWAAEWAARAVQQAAQAAQWAAKAEKMDLVALAREAMDYK